MSFSPELLAFVARLADASGAVIRRYFRTPITVDDKADNSPVTIADREVEQTLRAMIANTYPEHGIYGEEFGQSQCDAEYVWVIDPIDGTKSFITGKPFFGTLIALLHHGKPVLGVLDQPILQERWIGGQNVPTTFNGQTITVRSCSTLSKAALCATSPHMFVTPEQVAGFAQVRDQVKMPLYGGDCYAYGLLAMGFVDIVIEASLSPYDYCALVPIVQGAGGTMTDWQGQALGLQSNGCVIAAGDIEVHTQALTQLAIGMSTV